MPRFRSTDEAHKTNVVNCKSREENSSSRAFYFTTRIFIIYFSSNSFDLFQQPQLLLLLLLPFIIVALFHIHSCGGTFSFKDSILLFQRERERAFPFFFSTVAVELFLCGCLWRPDVHNVNVRSNVGPCGWQNKVKRFVRRDHWHNCGYESESKISFLQCDGGRRQRLELASSKGAPCSLSVSNFNWITPELLSRGRHFTTLGLLHKDAGRGFILHSVQCSCCD